MSDADREYMARALALAKEAAEEGEVPVGCVIVRGDTVIGEGCELCNVILDKDVVVRPGAKLIGTPTSPVIIKRGEVV